MGAPGRPLGSRAARHPSGSATSARPSCATASAADERHGMVPSSSGVANGAVRGRDRRPASARWNGGVALDARPQLGTPHPSPRRRPRGRRPGPCRCRWPAAGASPAARRTTRRRVWVWVVSNQATTRRRGRTRRLRRAGLAPPGVIVATALHRAPRAVRRPERHGDHAERRARDHARAVRAAPRLTAATGLAKVAADAAVIAARDRTHERASAAPRPGTRRRPRPARPWRRRTASRARRGRQGLRPGRERRRGPGQHERGGGAPRSEPRARVKVP